MNRKIEYIQLKESVAIPNLFAGESSFHCNSGKHGKIDMELISGMVSIKIKDREILVPIANMRGMLVAQEEPVKPGAIKAL